MKQTSYNPLRRFRWLLLLAVLLPIISTLSGCNAAPAETSTSQIEMAPMSDLPAEIQKEPVSVSEAYRFAIANPDALKNVPCYCGCGKVGHTSDYSCYIKEVKSSGEVVFDQHALGCGICVDIAQDVMKMIEAGKSPKDIRAAIDQTYSQYGPSNMDSIQ